MGKKEDDDMDRTMKGLEALMAAFRNNPNIDPADALATGLRASGRRVTVVDQVVEERDSPPGDSRPTGRAT